MCSSPNSVRSGGMYPGSLIACPRSSAADHEVLRLLERPDARGTALAAVAALLVSAHRCVTGGQAGVHLHRATADALGKTEPEREVARVDATRQSVVARVGDPHGVVAIAV